MAILREGIIAGNNYVNEIRKNANDLASISNDIINYLNGNENFQTFREGTEKGAVIYDNLNICVETIIEKLVPTIEKISMTTSNLLDEQQNLNKADTQYSDKIN